MTLGKIDLVSACYGIGVLECPHGNHKATPHCRHEVMVSNRSILIIDACAIYGMQELHIYRPSLLLQALDCTHHFISLIQRCRQ